jgi:excisionase family DNA binding protein
MSEEYYTPEEIAERFKVTKAAVYSWIRTGKLEATRLGRSVRISREALEAFLKASAEQAAVMSTSNVNVSA